MKAIDALEAGGGRWHLETLNEALFIDDAAGPQEALPGARADHERQVRGTMRRARVWIGANDRASCATCAIARAGSGEKEEEEERDDDGKVEEGALPGRLRALASRRSLGDKAPGVSGVAMIGDRRYRATCGEDGVDARD